VVRFPHLSNDSLNKPGAGGRNRRNATMRTTNAIVTTKAISPLRIPSRKTRVYRAAFSFRIEVAAYGARC